MSEPVDAAEVVGKWEQRDLDRNLHPSTPKGGTVPEFRAGQTVRYTGEGLHAFAFASRVQGVSGAPVRVGDMGDYIRPYGESGPDWHLTRVQVNGVSLYCPVRADQFEVVTDA